MGQVVGGGGVVLGVPSNSILNQGIRIFLENLRKPDREKGDWFLERMGNQFLE